ncbi:MAG: hypothetical protein HY255_07560 [Betaproteobacteria bacterium]|nr:hypothetical protein [Betaproteobacteria bacterium]
MVPAAPLLGLQKSDCDFYHRMDIPGIGTVGGVWDLRAGVADYLGGIDFRGRRVLEIGPASGFLTFWMESQGADVTCLEPDLDQFWDLLPAYPKGGGQGQVTSEFRRHIERVRKAFWFAHEHFHSRAKVLIGSAYALDDAQGPFDITVLGSVLLHTRLPTEIVHRSCALTREAVIVCERVFADIGDLPVMQLEQRAGSDNLDTWWRFSPELFRRLLALYGFPQQSFRTHSQPYWAGGRWNDIDMFTLTAQRAA